MAEEMELNDELVKSLAESQTALDSYSPEELEALLNYLDSTNSPYKEKLMKRVNQKLETTHREAFMNFIERPSYSVAAEYKEISQKSDTATPDELNSKQKIENLAKEALIYATPENINLANAVALNDYLEIAYASDNLKDYEKTQYDKLATNIEQALKEFDELNNLNRFAGMSPEQMDANEAAWLEVARNLPNLDKEETQIIAQMAAQHLKYKAPDADSLKVLLNEVEDLTAQYEEIKRIEIINQGAANILKSKYHLSDEQLAALQTDGQQNRLESDEDKKLYAELIENREKYLQRFADVSSTDMANIVAAQGLITENPELETVVKDVLTKIHKGQALSKDEDKLYQLILSRAGKYNNLASEAAKVAYAAQVEQLASRTARLTGAKDITDNTKNFLKTFASKHPKLLAYSKVAAIAGGKSLLSMTIGMVAGVNGLAAYSAYNTYNTYKKAYKKFEEQTGEKGFKNFIAYLKKPENTETRINLMRSLASSSIAVAFAAIGTATGLGHLPFAKRVANTAVNTVANGAKFFHKLSMFKNDNNEKNKKGLWAAGIGLAATGIAAACIFLPDETKEKISNWGKSLFKSNGEPEVDGVTGAAVKAPMDENSPEKFDPEKIREAGKVNPETGAIINTPHLLKKGIRNPLHENNNSETADKVAVEENKLTETKEDAAEDIAAAKKTTINYTYSAKDGKINSASMEFQEKGQNQFDEVYERKVIDGVHNDMVAKGANPGKYDINIQTKDGDNIHVEEETKIKNDLMRVHRKIETKRDEDANGHYSSTTKIHMDKEGNTLYQTTRYKSHEVNANTVGPEGTNGTKSDKLLRSAEIGDKKVEYIKDGDTGKTYALYSNKNEDGSYTPDKLDPVKHSRRAMRKFIKEQKNASR